LRKRAGRQSKLQRQRRALSPAAEP